MASPRGHLRGSRTDRPKAGTQHHLMVAATGVPLAAAVSAANARDMTGLLPTVTAGPLAGSGTPGCTPKQLLGGRAYRLLNDQMWSADD